MYSNTAKANKFVHLFSEVIDNNPIPSNFYGFTPLKKGSYIRSVYHPASHIIGPGSSTNQPNTDDITPKNLIKRFVMDRPLVIIFRPSIALDPLDNQEFLETIQKDIQIMGGALLIVSTSSIRDLKRNVSKSPHLWIISDPHNSIAEQFGLYNPENPISDWLSGIDANIPLPAYYVIQPSGEISYHYIDYNFRTYNVSTQQIYEQGFVRKLLTNIYQNNQQSNRKAKRFARLSNF